VTYRFRFLPTDVAPDRTPVKVVRYYDRSSRCWWAYPVNAAGDQLGDAQVDHFKDTLSMDPLVYPLWSH
jgi:hypothetical protein